MKARILLVWVIALVAGCGWWLLHADVGRGLGNTGIVPIADAMPLERVEILELRFRDGRLLRFERTESGWTQSMPFKVGIDTFSARQFGVVAADLEGVDAITLDGDSEPSAAQLGLDPPAATITWRWPDGEYTISLGNRTLAGLAWVRVGEDPRATLVDATLHQRVLETDARLWRDRALAPDAGAGSRRILIQAGNEELQLERGVSGWRMTSPVSTRADESSVADWLARVSLAKAAGYLHDQPDDLDLYGLEVPFVRIEIGGRDGEEPQIILLGDPMGVGSTDRYAMVWGSPSVLRIDEKTQRVLVPAAATLVDATGTGTVREDIASLEIRTPEGRADLLLERDFDQWVLRVDDSEPASIESGPVERLLAQLTNSRAGELAFTGYPQEFEQATVILFGFDGSPLDTVRIVQEPEQGRWGLENGDGVLRIFPASFAPPISPVDFGVSSE